MGRPGAGSSGGGHHSSSSHSFSRSSSSHSFSSSSSRARGSSGGSAYRGSYHHVTGGYRGPSRTHVTNNYYGGSSYRYAGGTTQSGSGWGFAVLVVMFVVFIAIAAVLAGTVNTPKSSYAREPIENPPGYITNCVVDEIGWFENVTRVERDLQKFYDKTGVQPYVVFKAYDASLNSAAAREQWAQKYYEDNLDYENVFLYVYFSARDSDNDLGENAEVHGLQAGQVMDAEAIEIFWAYLDSNWFSDKSMNDVIIDTFISTGDTIMQKSKTTADVMVTLLIVAAIIVMPILIIAVIKAKRKAEAEKAEETQRILSTPIQGFQSATGSAVTDRIAEQYKNK